MSEIWPAVFFWIAVFGTVGALIGPRKGYAPGSGAAIGAVFGIFGVLFLASRPDVDASQSRAKPAGAMVKDFWGRSREEVEAQYQRDQQLAREAGYQPVSLEWSVREGAQVLSVTYTPAPRSQ